MFSLIIACTLALLSSTNAQPHPAGGAAFVAFHDRLYVQGGDLGGGNLVNQFYSLDLSRSWQTISPVWDTLPSGPINAYHSGGFSADMNSFVTFGREIGSPYTTPNFINIFSTSTGSWIGTGSTMIADPTRRDMAIASDPSPGGQVYFMGGDAGQSGTGRSNVLDIYNLKSSVVSETSVPLPGPQNLQGGAATWLPNRNSMLVIGGLFDNTDTNSVFLFTPSSGTAPSTTNPSTSGSPNPPYGNTNPSFNSAPNVVVSGNNGNGVGTGGISSGTGNQNTIGWTAQTTTGYFPSLRTAHCVASNEDGSIVAVFGGFVNRSSTSDHSVYFLDTHTWTWTASTSNSVRGRSYSACAFSGNQFIVWGGFYQNPTSAPNNLPSVEESTMVYSLDAQNWVSTFVASKSSSSGAGSFPGSSDHIGNNGGELSNPKGKSIGLILAIAAVGAILALVTTGGAIMVIRRRNRRRLHNNNNGIGSNNGCSGSRSISGHNHGTTSMTSNLTIPSSTKIGAWDQKKMSNLESGLNNGPTSPSALTALGKSELGGHITEDIPPVTGYNNWEHRGSITSHRGDDMTTTTTMTTSPMVGITQTTIVTTPKNSTKSTKVGSIAPMTKKSTYTTSTGRRMSEQDIERMSISRNMNTFTRTDSQDTQTQDSWSESQQQHQANQPKLEQEFEEKSQGNYFPISVEREYR